MSSIARDTRQWMGASGSAALRLGSGALGVQKRDQ